MEITETSAVDDATRLWLISDSQNDESAGCLPAHRSSSGQAGRAIRWAEARWRTER